MSSSYHHTDMEKYNGWTNRETWAFNLHWQNDQGLCEMVKEWTREELKADGDQTDYALGQYVIERTKELWADFRTQSYDEMRAGEREFYPERHPLMMWERETGSVWRVDATEVGEIAREAVEGE